MFDTADAVLLARIQFAFTVSFHFLFPAFTIGLASFLAVLNGLWLWTKDSKYLGEMKKRAKDHGVKSLLIMCDGEGALGDAD